MGVIYLDINKKIDIKYLFKILSKKYEIENHEGYQIIFPKNLRILGFKKGKIEKTKVEYIYKYNYKGILYILELNNKNKVFLLPNQQLLTFFNKGNIIKFIPVNLLKKNYFLLSIEGINYFSNVVYEEKELIGLSSNIGFLRIKNIYTREFKGDIYDIKTKINNYIYDGIFLYS